MMRTACILGSIVMLICGALFGQSPIASLNTQRGDVVLVRATAADGAGETGAAIYIGHDENNALFVTALHVLRNCTLSQLSAAEAACQDATEIKIRFYSSGSTHGVKLFNNVNLPEDLAVLVLAVTELSGTQQPMQQRDPTPEMNIHILGHPSDDGWLPWVGTVFDENQADGDPNRFSTTLNAFMSGGYSGGPVLNSQGDLIGMHLRGDDECLY
jgi:hypothetical protein